jgi:glycosyltransferase involved in cell wall biosynthesis
MDTPLYADVTRLVRRHIGGIQHSGIDRVNVEYARWVTQMGGGLCVKRGREIKILKGKRWPALLCGEVSSGEGAKNRLRRLGILLGSLLPGESIPNHSRVFVSTHSWLAKCGVWERIRHCHIDSIVFIHDLIPLDYPEYSHPREKALHGLRLENTLRHSRAIIVNSQCTARGVQRFAKSKGLSAPPMVAAPLGHNISEISAKGVIASLLKHPYFLCLGTIEARKNHLLLLTLWREMAKRLGDASPQLVIAGRRGWECEQVIDLLERCDTIRPHVLEINNGTDSEIVSLIRGARALLMPSYAEGFGMPVLEALSLGTPVISSPLPAIREFAGDIPDYAEPHDGVRWLQLIEDYAHPDLEVRQNQIKRLAGFRDITWEEHFGIVGEFLNEIS